MYHMYHMLKAVPFTYMDALQDCSDIIAYMFRDLVVVHGCLIMWLMDSDNTKTILLKRFVVDSTVVTAHDVRVMVSNNVNQYIESRRARSFQPQPVRYRT